MTDSKLYLMFLWHMHQPYYVDQLTGRAMLPWVRLHALKDYYGMVALLRDFPKVHQTFNLVPSMVEQLNGYTEGHLLDEHLIYSRKDPASLAESEKQWIIANFFAANVQNMIHAYPRYAELHLKAKSKAVFTDDDLRDLQVWFRLCWFDYDERQSNPDLKQLITLSRLHGIG